MPSDRDRFKQVNDSLGMSAGDTILLTIARRLHRILKPQDSLSRFSGDQFALMLVSEQDPVKIAAVAEAVGQAISAYGGAGAALGFLLAELVISATLVVRVP